jgi:hypothetical protein
VARDGPGHSRASTPLRARGERLPAGAFGAPHVRDRVFAIAVADIGHAGLEGAGQTTGSRRDGGAASDAACEDRQGARPGREALGRVAAGGGVVAVADREGNAESPSTGESTSPRSGVGRPSTGLHLSPWFVEWMMGAPAGWSDPACPLSATEFSCRQASCADDGS